MLLTTQTHPDYKVFDCYGNQLGAVQSYDTETCEIRFVWLNGKMPVIMPDPEDATERVQVEIQIPLPGSYATDPEGNVVK